VKKDGDVKKLVAYSSVSSMGIVMLGLFALNPNGLNGAVMQMINHGIYSGALFLLVGIIYERRHTRKVSEFGGRLHIVRHPAPSLRQPQKRVNERVKQLNPHYQSPGQPTITSAPVKIRAQK